MVYLFHGEDEFTRTQSIGELLSTQGEGVPSEPTVLEGQGLTLEGLHLTAGSMPLLGEKRLVIIRDLGLSFESGRKSAQAKKFLENLPDYLSQLPESTDLIFLESGALEDENPLLEAIAEVKGAKIKEFKPPQGSRLVNWINKRAKEQGGKINTHAADTLAAFVGSNLRQLDLEITKLLAYVGEEPIKVEDVRFLVSQTQEANIFALVDALGEKDLETALAELHALLDQGQHPLQILAMIIRQFRLLLQGKELQLQGEGMAKLRLHPFVARKIESQARKFTRPQLEEIYHHLLDTDLGIKTGRAEPEVALDLLVTELATVPAVSEK
ncbi:MAG: DNA polymerase III subunit delta [Chloroflexi bacterium]|nr:DNA polymerase III subunit delta [Chloroflexota bacterium]